MHGFHPPILDHARLVLRRKHYALRTEVTYLSWIRRFILFHGRRDPGSLSASHVAAFLTHLAVEGHVAAATQPVLAGQVRKPSAQRHPLPL